MRKIFNISSAGGTATLWLSNLLNSHPNIVCFHGMRENPFLGDGTSLVSGRFFPGLLELRRLTGDMMSFGAVHSFYGPDGKALVTEAGGSHKFMIRNPFTRLHSLFTHHYRDFLGYSVEAGQNVYALAADRGHVLERTQIETREFTSAEAKFQTLCNEVVRTDVENLDSSADDECLLFEKMVSNRDYALFHLTDLLGGEREFLEQALAERMSTKENAHSAVGSLSDDEIFELWPETFRLMFATEMARHDPELAGVIARYEGIGYGFPQSYYRWASTFQPGPG